MLKYETLKAIVITIVLFITITAANTIVRGNKRIATDTYTSISPTKKKVLTFEDVVNVTTIVSDDMLSDTHYDDDAPIIYNRDYLDIDSMFVVSDFTKYDKNPSSETVRKIKELHIPELEKSGKNIKPIIVINSASRTYNWERLMNRSGKGQHVYSNGLGAVDISVYGHDPDSLSVLELSLMTDTKYNRIARYKSFIHADFAETKKGGRGYYKNTKYGWIYIGEIKE